MTLRLLLVIAMLLVPGALAEGLPDLGESSQSSFTNLDERRLGEEIMREVRADRTYYDDPEATDYLIALGRRLAARAGDSRQELNFFLIEDKQINAFALPGGHIGVHTGLILAAQSESEVASVVSHEIAHVTQRHIARIIAQQKSSAWMSLAGLAVALLAARSGGDAAMAAASIGQAGAVQNLLNFTREHEREADRVGLQTLEAAGFDVRAMPVFFDRLQRATRIYEGGAPSYLRTHPITYERMADVQNRIERLPYRQVPDSFDFHLVRAKLRALADSPAQARAYFDEALSERRYSNEAATRYGLVTSLVRVKDYARARRELDALRRVSASHPMVVTLGCRVSRDAGEIDNALTCYRDTLRAYPNHRAALYESAELLLQAGRADPALALVTQRLKVVGDDPKLYLLQARAYAALGRRHAQHRATGEAYARTGNYRAAVEQMQIALRSGDADFYQMSATEARLRELRKLDEAQRRESRR